MKNRKWLYPVSILIIVAAIIFASLYSEEISKYLTGVFSTSGAPLVSNGDSEFATKDTYCLPSPGADTSEAVTVIKAGEPLVYTGNTQGDYAEVQSPRYQPTCWVLVP